MDLGVPPLHGPQYFVTKKYVRLPAESLKPNVWYATYLNVFENLLTKGCLEDQALGYPRSSKLKSKYLEALPTATGGSVDYDSLFQTMLRNIRSTWDTLSAALDSSDPALFTLPNANLDTGLADATGKLVFAV